MREESAERRANRGDRGLTTRGRCLLAGGIAAMICSVLLDERDLLRVGIVVAALPLVAMMATMGHRIHLSADHQVTPDKLRPGTAGIVQVLLRNSGGRRSGALEVTEPGTPGIADGVRCLVPPLRSGATGVAAYPLFATRRGRFLLGPPRVRVSDPFGLWENHSVLPARTEIMVVPKVVPLMGMPTGAGTWSAASGQALAGTTGGDPDVGIRHYNSGDDIRMVHWRASARHDELMVRLAEPVSHGSTTVLLDHRARAHRGLGAASSLETAVTAAASVSLHLLDGDYQLRLVGHTGAVIAHGNDIADDVLAGLADISGDVTGDLQPGAVATAGLLIAVLGDLDPADTRRLVAARSRSSHAIALLLVTEWWNRENRPGNSVAVTAGMLSAGGWRVVLVHPQDDLAECWRRACHAGDGYGAPFRRVS